MSRIYRKYEQGVTSLVIVMFSILLLVTVTVSFMQIMINEQTRTDDSELSQGAYDSALAGVEDGKRVLAACQTASDITLVQRACDAIKAEKCTTVSDVGFATAEKNGEVYLKTTSTSGNNGKEYEQAYTCVSVRQETSDFKGTLAQADTSGIVPLKGVKPFTSIEIFWRIPGVKDTSVNSVLAGVTLPALSKWNDGLTSQRPALMRAQLIQYKSGELKSSSFDDDRNGHTLYLYPTIPAVPKSLSFFDNDKRRSGALKPQPVLCTSFLTQQGYNCKATITLPVPIDGNAASRVAYLRLTSLYVGADYMVRLLGSDGKVVEFDGVQPSIDSTGRAADVFRRVDARVELIDPIDVSLYPRATVDITNNFCKTFTVSTLGTDYDDGTSKCKP